ncbi:MAG: tetratricopeptide repeat protein [Anaerolineae bacterium]|nr:tetratricopeptide repeat protein [Anaerolineae bacterium]
MRALLARLDDLDLSLVRALAVLGAAQAVDAGLANLEAVHFILEPFTPGLMPGALGERLHRLAATHPALVSGAGEQAALAGGEEMREAVLLAMDQEGATESTLDGHRLPRVTRRALCARAARFFEKKRTAPDTWQTLQDLTPQLAEFEMHCLGENYDAAARLLAEIGFPYLMRWGHYAVLAAMRERLLGHLTDLELQQSNLGELGSVYASLGDNQKAIRFQEQALALAQARGDAANEHVWLSNLGNRYLSLGQLESAMLYYSAAMRNAEARQDLRGVCFDYIALGTCNAQLGLLDVAREWYEKAQDIARTLGDVIAEGYCHANLGIVYTTLGMPTRAIAHHDQAIAIAQDLGSRLEQSRRMSNLAETLLAIGQFDEAFETLREAKDIATSIGYKRGLNFSGGILTTAYLLTGDFTAARSAAEEAGQVDTPQNNHNVMVGLGIAALRLGDFDTAANNFLMAIQEGEEQLDQNQRSAETMVAVGMAHAGLAICRDSAVEADRAVDLFVAARAVSSAPGLIQRSLLIFDVLAAADAHGRLDGVREAITGAESG